MKNNWIIKTLIVWPLWICSIGSRENPPRFGDPAKGFALVELYTSEGCSSCPPADELVGKLSGIKDNVIVLSYHVDYWDYLGWKDSYSNPLYSRRQQEYGNYFHLSSIYTPQIVVNGGTEFVGSNEAQLDQAIHKALQEIPVTEIGLAIERESNQISVTCKTEGDGDDQLNMVLVQKNASDFVQRGENHGKKLNHYFIVRDFQSQPGQAGSHIFSLKIPAGLHPADCLVVAFLQNKKTGHIIAASRSSLI